jgi:hypothetical protein
VEYDELSSEEESEPDAGAADESDDEYVP